MWHFDRLSVNCTTEGSETKITSGTQLKYQFKTSIGMWRSLVAYTSGGRRVAGSNPVIPTNKKRHLRMSFFIGWK